MHPSVSGESCQRELRADDAHPVAPDNRDRVALVGRGENLRRLVVVLSHGPRHEGAVENYFVALRVERSGETAVPDVRKPRDETSVDVGKGERQSQDHEDLQVGKIILPKPYSFQLKIKALAGVAGEARRQGSGV